MPETDAESRRAGSAAETPGPADSASGEALTITVVRSGGFAGLSREWRVSPPSADHEEWCTLLDACPWGAKLDDPASRDRFVYSIEVRRARRRSRATVPERELQGPWRELVDRVREVETPPDSKEPAR